MYTRKQTNFIYGFILLIVAVAMMTSCNLPAAPADLASTDDVAAPSAPYAAPYFPAGECHIAYTIDLGGTLFQRCRFAIPAGMDPDRIAVLASVSSGSWTVESWLVNAFVVKISAFEEPTINATFQLRNVGSKAVSATATATIAVAQTLTPTAATVGVE